MLIKLRFRFSEVLFGILIASALFALGMVYGSSRNPPSQQITATANKNPTEHIDNGFWDWIFHDATGIFTFLLVLVGSFQIAVFLRQLRLIKESLAPAREAADAARNAAQHVPIVERAYISGGGYPHRDNAAVF